VIFALAYTAWRNGQTTSQNSHVQPQAPPPIATQPALPETAPPSTAKTATPDGLAPSDKHSAIPSNSERSGESAPVKNRGNKKQDQPLTTRAIAKNPPETASRNGSEELSMAQAYLSGTSGEPRNSAEAAKWLWKSMAKHNSTATLTLADLYLKGDGVAKNCDQARVLLDSAARAGMKQAGEQLRHLQAFGCE
jgi:TPR repeat protein